MSSNMCTQVRTYVCSALVIVQKQNLGKNITTNNVQLLQTTKETFKNTFAKDHNNVYQYGALVNPIPSVHKVNY